MKYYDLLAAEKFMVKDMKKFLVVCLLGLSFASQAFQDQTLYLPDGTQINIVNDKAYYRCKRKTVLLPDGRYLLADGSKLTIKKSEIVELSLY